MAYWSKRNRPRPVRPGVPTVVDRQPYTGAVMPLPPTWNHVAPRTQQRWQRRAEFFCDTLGLVRFANGLLAQSAARCALLVEKLVDPVKGTWEPVDERIDYTPSQVLREYKGRFAESAGDLVASHVYAYKATGECFLVVDADPDGGLNWEIRSVRSLQFRTNDVLVLDLPGGSISDGTARAVPTGQVIRMWVPDETWPAYATSHMKGVIADCDRYWALARRIQREAESVLTNGLLFTPEYAHKYPPPEPGRPASEQTLSKFDRDYYQIAEQAFTDDESVAASAALSTHYGHEDGKSDPKPPEFIYPGRNLDPSTIKLREEAAENIARGLDLPTQLALSGQGGLKPGTGGHYSAWLMSEDFIKTSVAPTMDRVLHADLSAAMFRPTLAMLGREGKWPGNPALYRIGYDATPITIHPDRAASSIQLYGMGLMSALPVLEANGFNASDQPTPQELAQILEALRAIHGRQPESIQLQTGPVSSPATQGITGLGAGGQDAGGVGPATVKELPPAPALAAVGAHLSPYPGEMADWLDG